MVDRDLEGRGILVLGGSSGIGLTAVGEFAKAGATVLVGTTKPENFARGMKLLARKEKIDPSTLSIQMFNADITDRKQLRREAFQAKNRGFVLTDVVFSQAAGMEGVTSRMNVHLDPITDVTFATPIDELAPDKRAEVEDKLALFRKDLEVWTKEAMPHAKAVLFDGTYLAMEELDKAFPGGFRGAAINSTWGHLAGKPGMEIPLLYGPIEEAKGQLRDSLAVDAPGLFEAYGIEMSMVVASLVNDTRVGKMFNDFFLNLMEKDQREAVRDSSVHSKDVARGIRQVLDLPRKLAGTAYPDYLFVYREKGEIVMGDSLPLSPMYTKPYKF